MTSFSIIRTKPSLASNIKLIVSKDGLFLDSFRVGKLNQSSYKGIKVFRDSNFIADTKHFKALTSDLFSAKFESNINTIRNDFVYQYENVYNMGADYLRSKLFSEENSFFAPFYFNGDIPECFMVFRIPDSVSYPQNTNITTITSGTEYVLNGTPDFKVEYETYTYENGETFIGNNDASYTIVSGSGNVVINDENAYLASEINSDNFKSNIIDKMELVQTFDMTEGSALGDYLRNTFFNEAFPSSPLSVDMTDTKVTYRGIDPDSGSIKEYVESLNEYVEEDSPMWKFDRFISEGFKRNKLIFPNIINLEFAFDDDISDEYTINRYVGFYVNKKETGGIRKLDKDTTISGIIANGEKTWKRESFDLKFSDTALVTTFDGYPAMFYERENVTGCVYTRDEMNPNPSLYYIDGKTKTYMVSTEDAYGDTEIRLSHDNTIDMRDLYTVELNAQIDGDRPSIRGIASTIVTISDDFAVGDKIVIRKDGTYITQVIADTLPLWTGDYSEGQSAWFYFYPTGTVDQICEALISALEYASEDVAPLRYHYLGDGKILVYAYGQIGNDYEVNIVGVSDENMINVESLTSGGSTYNHERFVISVDDVVNVAVGDFIKSGTYYLPITSIDYYLDEIEFDESGEIVDMPGFDTHRAITVLGDKIDISPDGSINIYREMELKYGMLELFPIKEFDNSVTSSVFSERHDIEISKYFDVKTLETGITYKVLKRSSETQSPSIIHNAVTYAENDTFTAVDSDYTVLAGDPLLIDIRFISDGELKGFYGFESLYNVDGIDPANNNLNQIDGDLVENKEHIISTNAVASEYLGQKELYYTDYTTQDVLLPTWCKWGSITGKDCRLNQQRLNLFKAFGALNFSPSQISENRNPAEFTNEWYFLNRFPENVSVSQKLNSKHYFQDALSADRLKSMEDDYFTSFFKINKFGFVESDGVYRSYNITPQERFTTFKYSESGTTCLFRGVKYRVKELSDDGNELSTRKYDGYKFSTILNVENSSESANPTPIKYQIIANDKYKTITVVVTITLDDYKTNGAVDYVGLYTVSSIKEWNGSSFDIGKEYNIPTLVGKDLYASSGGAPVGPPITTFRGIQMPPFNVINTDVVGSKELVYPKTPSTIYDFRDLLILNQDGQFGRVFIKTAGGVFGISSLNGYYSSSQAIYDKASTYQSSTNDYVQFAIDGLYMVNVPGLSIFSNYRFNQLNSLLSQSDIDDLRFFYEDGGFKVYDNILNLTTLASFKKLVNDGSIITESYYVDENGVTQSKTSSFKLEILEPSKISKSTMLVPSLVTEPIAGSIGDFQSYYSEDYISKNHTIYRYSDDFAPMFRDVIGVTQTSYDKKWHEETETWGDTQNIWQSEITELDLVNWDATTDPPIRVNGVWYSKNDQTSWNTYKATVTNWKDVNIDIDSSNRYLIKMSSDNQRTAIDINNAEFGIMKDVYFHRVNINSDSILKTDKPVYPLIGETTVLRKDISGLLSPFSGGYYTESLSRKNGEVLRNGTRSLKEEKSFLISQLSNIPGEIEVYDMGSESITIKYGFDDTFFTSCIATMETSSHMIFRVNVENMVENLMYSKFETIFQNNFLLKWMGNNKTSFEDAAREYVRKNISPLYTIGTIDIYTKNADAYGFDFSGNIVTKLNNGFTKQKGVSENRISDSVIDYRYNKKTPVVVSAIITLKKI